MNIQFKDSNNVSNIVLNLEVEIPRKEWNECTEQDLLESRNAARQKTCELIRAFSYRLIDSLKRRMAACQKNLLNHINDCTAYGGCTIMWIRKDGTKGYFNIPSFETMKDAVDALEHRNWWTFYRSKPMVDQTIKALMNDPEQDHSDAEQFRYSELVSALCEALVVVDGESY